jgi:hypothetical protein
MSKQTLLVGHLAAQVHAFADGGGVDEGLEGGAHLTPRLFHVVVLEVLEVDAAHPGLHEAGMRIHAQQAALQEALVIADRIHRAHHRIRSPFQVNTRIFTGVSKTFGISSSFTTGQYVSHPPRSGRQW